MRGCSREPLAQGERRSLFVAQETGSETCSSRVTGICPSPGLKATTPGLPPPAPGHAAVTRALPRPEAFHPRRWHNRRNLA